MGALLGRFFGVPLRPQTYRNLAYLTLAFPLGLVYFVALAAGVSTGLSLVLTLVGVPLLLLTVAAATAVAGFEARLATFLGVAEATPPAALRDLGDADLRSVDGVVDATKRLLTAPTTWTSLLLVLLKFVLGLVAFVALVTTGALAVSFLTMPLFYDVAGVVYTIGPYVVDSLPGALLGGALGVLLTLVSLHLLNGLARLYGFTTVTLLGDAAEPEPERTSDGA